MLNRYELPILTVFAVLLLGALSPTSVLGQSGACCGVPPNQAASKNLAVEITCFEDSELSCQLDGNIFVGDGVACGTSLVFYESVDQCVQDAQGLLPVELTSFEALVDQNAVVLSWQTGSETNNAGFSVEQEIGSDAFAELAFVEGHGTTFEMQTYRYAIRDLDVGVHRFRLKQVDFDGSFEYSSVVEAAVAIPDQFLIEAAYPNPFNPTTTIRFAVASEQHVEVTLVNAAGQSIRSLLSGTVAANTMQQIAIDASGLPSGTYLVHFEGNGLSASERIVLMK
ncbi:T9SS type A sorting domain-containing protein [Bacteroidota bacterium]